MVNAGTQHNVIPDRCTFAVDIRSNECYTNRELFDEMGRTPFGSPTLSDQALMSFPSMKMGPGKSSRSHTADEFIFIKEIEEAITLYLDLLDGATI